MGTLLKTFALISNSTKRSVSSSQPTAVTTNQNPKSELAAKQNFSMDSVSPKESNAEVSKISSKEKMRNTLENSLTTETSHESVMVNKLLQFEICSFYL